MLPRKLVEQAIRLLPVALIPILVTPALVFLAVRSQPPEYASEALVWLDEIPMLTPTALETADLNIAPAHRHAQVLGELLGTQSFREQVAVRAGLLDEALAQSDEPEARRARLFAAEEVWESVEAGAEGVNLLSIAARNDSPVLAQALASATMEQYLQRLNSDVVRRRDVAVEYFDTQLALAQQELQDRRAAAAAYQAAHPEVAEGEGIDLQFDALVGQVTAQQQVVENLLQSLGQAHREAATLSEGITAQFRVEDRPQLPFDPIPPSRTERYGYPLVGLVIGAGLAAALVFASYRVDHSVQSSEDLARLRLPVLAYVPVLRARRPWYMIRRPSHVREAWRGRRRPRPAAASRQVAAGLSSSTSGASND